MSDDSAIPTDESVRLRQLETVRVTRRIWQALTRGVEWAAANPELPTMVFNEAQHSGRAVDLVTGEPHLLDPVVVPLDDGSDPALRERLAWLAAETAAQGDQIKSLQALADAAQVCISTLLDRMAATERKLGSLANVEVEALIDTARDLAPRVGGIEEAIGAPGLSRELPTLHDRIAAVEQPPTDEVRLDEHLSTLAQGLTRRVAALEEMLTPVPDPRHLMMRQPWRVDPEDDGSALTPDAAASQIAALNLRVGVLEQGGGAQRIIDSTMTDRINAQRDRITEVAERVEGLEQSQEPGTPAVGNRRMVALERRVNDLHNDRAEHRHRIEALEASRATLVGQVNGLVEREEATTDAVESRCVEGVEMASWRASAQKAVDDLRSTQMGLEVESGQQTEAIVRILDRLKQVERAAYIPEDEHRYPTKGFETLSEFVKGPRPMLSNDDEGGPSREQIAAKRAAGETLNYEEAWAATYDEQRDLNGPGAVEGVSREAPGGPSPESLSEAVGERVGQARYSSALERAMEVEDGVPESELRPEPLPESEGVKLMPIIDPLTGKPIEPLPPAGAAMGVDGKLVLEAKPEGGPPPMLLARMTAEGAIKLVVDPSDNSIEAGKEPLLDPFSEAVAALVQMVRRGDMKDKNVIRAAKALLDRCRSLDDARPTACCALRNGVAECCGKSLRCRNLMPVRGVLDLSVLVRDMSGLFAATE